MRSDWDRWLLNGDIEPFPGMMRRAPDADDRQRKIAQQMTRESIGFKLKLKCIAVLKKMREK